jgi:hypothetical protein
MNTYISQILVLPPAVPPVTPMNKGLFLMSNTYVPGVDINLFILIDVIGESVTDPYDAS